MSAFEVDAKDIDALAESLVSYGAGSGQVVDRVLHGSGAEAIKRAIPSFIHPSGRRWRGKGASIAGSPSAGSRLSQDDGTLSVTIAARRRLGYLYFPDDGTDTKRHAGDQRFMERGAEVATPQIIEECTKALVSAFGDR